jgi:hypothetical protein
VHATTASSPESVNPTDLHIVVRYRQNEVRLNKRLMMFSFQNNRAAFFMIFSFLLIFFPGVYFYSGIDTFKLKILKNIDNYTSRA